MNWRIEAEADRQTITGTTLLALDFDPRIPRLRLGLRIRTGGDPELYSGAVIRRFLPVEAIDWAPIVAWLSSTAAVAMLQRITDGYTGTRLWSGDWTGEWTEDALDALDAVHAEVSDRAAQP